MENEGNNKEVVTAGYSEWYTTNDGQLWRYRPDATVEYMD